MKATEAKLLSFLQRSPQFIIPIYQRTYSWTEKQCRQLWDDILRAGMNEAIAVHFIGSVVYVEQGLSQVTNQSPVLVIDGQQRLTTLSLLLEALARALGEGEPVDGFSAAKLRHYYLSNPLEAGDRYYKLLLSQTDNASLKSIIKNLEQPQEPSLRITENFDLFAELLAEHKDALAVICRGLAKLAVVDVALTRGQDNPQLIFESLNSTGKELSQADLIRNFILMGLEPELQTRLYEVYWRPMEVDFGQEAYGTQFDSFMRHYLTVRTGDIPREREVYEAFKDYSHTTPVQQAGIEALVKDIRAFARCFCAMALGTEQDARLGQAFHDLRELKVDVAYPFLLELYYDYANAALDAEDFETAVRLVEAYVFRRAICSIPTNSMNKTFATSGKALRKDRYLESIQAYFLTLPSYRRFPGDEEFRRDLQKRDLYNFRSRSYWLRRLENHGRKERVPVDEYTIEHILPQNPELSSAWRRSLGAEWQRVQEEYLHTLGNLTLTGYNSEYSDKPFTEKRDMDGGFRHSPLKVNEGLGALSEWNEVTIRERAARLAEQAATVWKAPRLEAEVLDRYQPERTTGKGPYTIDSYPNLLAPGLRDVFTAFQKEVLALDACVSDEFRRWYVAFKAEASFVHVLPKPNKLHIFLIIPFADLNDPRRLCKHQKNGDVRVRLDSIDGLPYVMGLVRQCFERQMGDEGAA